MKRAFSIFASLAILFIAAGCHAQHPVTPPTAPTCPPAGSYVDLNGATGSASTTYTATNVTTPICFEAQGYLNGKYGTASNIVGPTTGGPTGSVLLSVSCTVPSPNPNNLTCNVTWVFQSAPAVVPLAPAQGSMGSPTTSQVVKPEMPLQKSPACFDCFVAGTGVTLTAKLEK